MWPFFFLICCIHHFLDFYFLCNQFVGVFFYSDDDQSEIRRHRPKRTDTGTGSGNIRAGLRMRHLLSCFQRGYRWNFITFKPNPTAARSDGLWFLCSLFSTRQIIRSQEILAESRSRPAEAQAEVKNLQAELHSTLRTLQEEQQQQDSENLLDDDKVPKATCQCSSFVEFSLSVRGISTTLTKCIRRRGHTGNFEMRPCSLKLFCIMQ